MPQIQRAQVNASDRVKLGPSPAMWAKGITYFPHSGSTAAGATIAVDCGAMRITEPISAMALGDPLNEANADQGPRVYLFPEPVMASDSQPVNVDVVSAGAERYTFILLEN